MAKSCIDFSNRLLFADSPTYRKPPNITMHDLKSVYAYRGFEICRLSQIRTNFHKFQNICKHTYLYFKQCTLLPDNGTQGSKHITFIDDIIKNVIAIDPNIHNIHTIYTQYAQNIHTIYTQYAHNMHTIYTQYTHNIQTIYPQYAHNMHTIYTQYTHNIHTIYTQYTHNIHTTYTQYTHNIHTIYTQY